jgi:hypothetical protein
VTHGIPQAELQVGQLAARLPTIVAARFYTGDHLPHLYLANELNDPTLAWLIPPGHRSFPDQHARGEVLEHAAPAPAALCDACPRCAAWVVTSVEGVLVQDG